MRGSLTGIFTFGCFDGFRLRCPLSPGRMSQGPRCRCQAFSSGKPSSARVRTACPDSPRRCHRPGRRMARRRASRQDGGRLTPARPGSLPGRPLYQKVPGSIVGHDVSPLDDLASSREVSCRPPPFPLVGTSSVTSSPTKVKDCRGHWSKERGALADELRRLEVKQAETRLSRPDVAKAQALWGRFLELWEKGTDEERCQLMPMLVERVEMTEKERGFCDLSFQAEKPRFFQQSPSNNVLVNSANRAERSRNLNC